VTLRPAALAAALLALATHARAAERIAIVAVADPPAGPDAELAELTHQLRAECRERAAGVEEVQAMRSHLMGDAGPASLVELDRAYAGALVSYQAGEFERSVIMLRGLVDDLEKVPENPEAYAQWKRALLRLAHAAATIGLDDDVEASFDKLARTDPGLSPDPDQFSPGYRRRYEAARKRVAALPRRKLRVDSRGGPGTVFVNGRPVGAPPLEIDLPAGRYRVGGAAGTARVPSVRVDLSDDRTVTLDFALVDSVRPSAGPGLALPASERGAELVRAGAWLGVDRLVAVGRATEAGTQFLVGSVYDVPRGALLREGSIRIAPAAQPASLAALAAFLLTGQSTRGVEDRTALARLPEPTPAARSPVATAAAATSGLAARPPHAEVATAALGQPAGWLRPAAYGAGAGALALAAVAVQQAMVASRARDGASAMVDGGSLVPGSDPAHYRDLVAKGDAAARNAWISAGLSAALAATAGVLGWRSVDRTPAATGALAVRF